MDFTDKNFFKTSDLLPLSSLAIGSVSTYAAIILQERLKDSHKLNQLFKNLPTYAPDEKKFFQKELRKRINSQYLQLTLLAAGLMTSAAASIWVSNADPSLID